MYEPCACTGRYPVIDYNLISSDIIFSLLFLILRKFVSIVPEGLAQCWTKELHDMNIGSYLRYLREDPPKEAEAGGLHVCGQTRHVSATSAVGNVS